jgi:hypothetical protein
LGGVGAVEREGETVGPLARGRAVRAKLAGKIFNTDDIDTLKEQGRP